MNRCLSKVLVQWFDGVPADFLQFAPVTVRINTRVQTMPVRALMIFIAQMIIPDAIIDEGSGETARSGTRLLCAAVAALERSSAAPHDPPNFGPTFGV
jgi:hypothetical protein